MQAESSEPSGGCPGQCSSRPAPSERLLFVGRLSSYLQVLRRERWPGSSVLGFQDEAPGGRTPLPLPSRRALFSNSSSLLRLPRSRVALTGVCIGGLHLNCAGRLPPLCSLQENQIDQSERRSGQTHTERMALALLIQLTEKINGLAGGRSQGKAWGMETPRE